MMTTLDLVDIVWQRLNGSQLKTAITGGLYKHRRPAGSQSEDVIINSLPINNLQLQSAIVNVNIHVPNLTIAIGGVQDTRQPDSERLNELAKMAVGVISEVWAEDYNYDVQQQVLFEDEEAGDHYINIRIEFFNINIKN
jgi:hypothetical protein